MVSSPKWPNMLVRLEKYFPWCWDVFTAQVWRTNSREREMLWYERWNGRQTYRFVKLLIGLTCFKKIFICTSHRTGIREPGGISVQLGGPNKHVSSWIIGNRMMSISSTSRRSEMLSSPWVSSSWCQFLNRSSKSDPSWHWSCWCRCGQSWRHA